MSFPKDYDGVSTARFVEVKGTMLQELIKGDKGLEFSIEAPANKEVDKMEDLWVDTAYQYEQYANHLNLDCLNLADEDANVSPFDVMAKKMTKVTPDGGILKRIKRNGSGGVPPEKSLLFLHYNSYLELEEVPFDSSYLRSSKNCFKLRLGEGSVYPGFELAVASMAQGEKSQFLIHPDYAFKEMGVPPRIPPSSTILLEVDLLKWISGDVETEGPNQGEYEDLKSFKVAFRKAKVQHLKGNSFFEAKNFSAAVNCYKRAADTLTSCSLMNDQEESDQKKLLLKVYRNQCICYNKLNMPQKVCIAAREAIFIDPISGNRDAKLHFNWGKALVRLANFSKAAEHLRKAQSLDPNCNAITEELVQLEERRKEQLTQDKITYKRALGLNQSSPKKENNKPDLSKENSTLVKEVEEFSKSSRSRMELPTSLTKEEKEVARNAAQQFDLIYKETKRMNGDTVIAITK